MYGYTILALDRQSVIEVGYGYETRDDAHYAGLRRCLDLIEPLMFCPFFRVFGR